MFKLFLFNKKYERNPDQAKSLVYTFVDTKRSYKRRFWIYAKWGKRGYFENWESFYGVYAYILSMCRGCVCVMSTIDCCAPPTPHRWTAITVGAIRAHPARGPLSTIGFLQTRLFCANAGVCVIYVLLNNIYHLSRPLYLLLEFVQSHV